MIILDSEIDSSVKSTETRHQLERPRVCILSQYFPPEMGAPQARLSELGSCLMDLGWEVEVLTALPNYPTGKVFPGYDLSKPCVQRVGRLRVARVPLYASNRGFLSRLYCYFSFVVSAIRHGPRLCRRPNILFVESPPLFISYAARYLARRWRCPYVFNVSDLWPETAIRMDQIKPGILTWLAERLELKTYRHAGGVSGQSDDIIKSVRKRCPETRATVITNGVMPDRFGKHKADQLARDLLGPEPGPVFIFAGLFGRAQGLDQILELAKSLPADSPGRFVLVGDGPVRDRLIQRIDSELIRRVRVIGIQPRDRIPALLAAADAAIIPLGFSIPGAVPSKVYEAMASELPILLIAQGEAERRVVEAGAGLSVQPWDLDQFREAYLLIATDVKLRERLGAAGRRAAEQIYSRDVLAQRLDQFLRDLLPDASPVERRIRHV